MPRRSPSARTGAELVEYPVWMWHWAYARRRRGAVGPRARAVPLSRAAVDRKQRCGAVLSQPVRADDGRCRRPGACRRSCCAGCSRWGRWSSADRSTARRLLRPHVRRVGRPVAAGRRAGTSSASTRSPWRCCPMRGTGTRSNRDARSACSPNCWPAGATTSPPPTSRRPRWMPPIAAGRRRAHATRSRCCARHSTSLGRRQAIRSRRAVGGRLLPGRRRAARGPGP